MHPINHWGVKEIPRIVGKTLVWSGKRPFREKDDDFLPLKLGKQGVNYHFEFYSRNGAKEHYGKSHVRPLILLDSAKYIQLEVQGKEKQPKFVEAPKPIVKPPSPVTK